MSEMCRNVGNAPKENKESCIPADYKGMSLELCDEFIHDEKYSDVRNYFLSAFKRLDMLNDKLIKKIDFENMPEEDYEKYGYLIEEIGEIACRCEDLLERAYYD